MLARSSTTFNFISSIVVDKLVKGVYLKAANTPRIFSCARNGGFFSTVVVGEGEDVNVVVEGESLDKKKNISHTKKIPVQQSWAVSILDKSKIKRGKVDEDHSSSSQVLKRPVGATLASSRVTAAGTASEKISVTPVYRRRLADMSWTKEPMDDKLIWVDCEMTGLDYNKEMIMEIGCIITDSNLREIARQPSVIIHVPEESLSAMDSWCMKHHGDSGLIEACRQSRLTSEEVDEQLLQFVEKHTKLRECPMAGNSIHMDRIFISKQFPKFYSHFHYRNVDVSTIKELVRRWYPNEYQQAPKKKFSHRVLDDILDSIAELQYYRSSVFSEPINVSSAVRKQKSASSATTNTDT